MNTPMVKASPLGVRGPHHDKLVEIFAGLLYLRQEDDRSTGASLGVYKCVKVRSLQTLQDALGSTGRAGRHGGQARGRR
jgi:hypothetical protein